MSKKNYDELANEIINAVGGKKNVSTVTHCMTRLRFNLKDESLPNDENLKDVKGVLGVTRSGGQYQVIIGQTVDEVYETVRQKIGNDPQSGSNDRESEKSKEKLTLKKIGNNILNGLAGSLTPLIPVLIAASMFKMVPAVFGPAMFGLMSETGDLFKLLTFVGDAGFYFFPILVGYTASKKFGATPVLGMFLGGILIHPTFLQMATEGIEFSVYGIPTQAINYTSSVIPAILSAWILSYVERFFNKYLPSALKAVFAPTLSIAVMLPIAFVVLAPVGFIVGNWISQGLLSLDNVAGFLAVAIIAAIYQLLVLTGMHVLLVTTLITVFASTGQESVVMPAAAVASICVAGMCLGTFLRINDKEEKSLGFGFFIASFIGGVTEPGLYGLAVRYRKPFIGLISGGFAGGLYAGLTGVTAYTLVPSASVLAITAFVGGPTANLVNGIIACVIGFVVSAVVSYVIGVEKKEGNKKNVDSVALS